MSLKLDDIYPIIKSIFPAQNDFFPCSYSEEFSDLLEFKIDSKEKLTDLLNKHYDTVMKEDSAVEVDEATYDYFCDELGKKIVDERIEAGFWYSFPALLRLALENEFGEAYLEFAYKRDGIED